MSTCVELVTGPGDNTMRILSLAFIMVIVCSVFAQQQPWEVPYQIEGVWMMVDGDGGSDLGKAKITIKNDTLSAVITEIFGRSRGEVAVCDLCIDSLKGRPLVGMTILKGFRQKDRIWRKGRMLDIQDGKWYRAELELSPDETTLSVFSYIRFIVKVGKTQKWVKIQ
jgi:uncharacterized protein (DUF2147 family)